jgi:hypothetical protein
MVEADKSELYFVFLSLPRDVTPLHILGLG